MESGNFGIATPRIMEIEREREKLMTNKEYIDFNIKKTTQIEHKNMNNDMNNDKLHK